MFKIIHDASGKNIEIKSHLTKKEVFGFFKCIPGLALMVAFMTNGIILFGFSYFLPTVVAT